MSSHEKAHEQPRKGPSWIGLRPPTLLKWDSSVVVFKFLGTSILKNISKRLLLNRIWKRCWKYPCKWFKKDLSGQEAAFKFLKTFINFLWNFRFMQYCYCPTCSKFAKYFQFSHVFVTLLLKRVSPVKSKHIITDKESNPFEWHSLTNLHSNESQIFV